MQSHPSCIILKLEIAFCKRYCTIRNDEQIYIALRVIKQSNIEKVEVYYDWIFKLANCLKANNNLLTNFFRTGLVPCLCITTIRMKRDTLFKHKESTITYEETMVDVEEYQKLLETLKKQKKTLENI